NSLMFALIFLCTIGHFMNLSLITVIYTVLTAFIIVASIFHSKGLPKIRGMIMVVIGTLTLAFQQQPLDIWAEGLTKNLPLICLIVVVPVLGIPIGLGNYHQQIAGFTARFQDKPQFLYLFISGLDR